MNIKTNANQYKGREVFANTRASVYRNLHQDSLSIRVGNLVHGHAKMVAMSNAQFNVGTGGSNKAKETGKKQVHAWLTGDIQVAQDCDVEATYQKLEKAGYERVRYNPMDCSNFVKYSSNEPVLNAREAIIVLDRVYIKN